MEAGANCDAFDALPDRTVDRYRPTNFGFGVISRSVYQAKLCQYRDNVVFSDLFDPLA
jgi:hypothetical protein